MYGFFGTVVAECEGRGWEYEKVLNTPTEVYLLSRCALKDLQDYRKNLHELQQPKTL